MNKVLFWDFDGTLAHSDSLWTGNVHRALTLGVPGCAVTREDIRPHMKTGFTWHAPEGRYDHLASSEAWWGHMCRRFSLIYQGFGIDKTTADETAACVRELVLEGSNYTLYDDALPTLQACVDAGFRNFMLSNNYPELAEVACRLGLSPYFSGCIVSGVTGYEKPRREIFEIALEQAGHPDICYMIGDNPVADIAGAKACGIPAILVHGNADCGADYVCAELKDVLVALGIPPSQTLSPAPPP